MSIKKCTKCGVDKALTEFRKRAASKDGLTYNCKSCASAYQKKQYQDPDVRALRIKQANEYYHNDTEAGKASRRAYYKNNTKAMRAWQSEYRKHNRPLYNAANAKRRAKKLQATPDWADMGAITAIYQEAQRLQDLLGVPMHIDHVIPLQGELVCGLHVETNLAIIPATLNLKKSNKFKVE